MSISWPLQTHRISLTTISLAPLDLQAALPVPSKHLQRVTHCAPHFEATAKLEELAEAEVGLKAKKVALIDFTITLIVGWNGLAIRPN